MGDAVVRARTDLLRSDAIIALAQRCTKPLNALSSTRHRGNNLRADN